MSVERKRFSKASLRVGFSIFYYLYAVGLIGYGALRLITGETLGMIKFVDNFMPALSLPSIVLLVLALLLRRWRAMLIIAPSVIALVIVYGSTFIPHAATNDAPDLTLMTYNLNYDNSEVAEIADVMRASGAGIVVIQEAQIKTIQAIAKQTADIYPYHTIHIVSTKRLALGAFSAYPLLVDDYNEYQPQSSRLRLQIEIKNTRITIYDVHLANPLDNRQYDPVSRGQGVDGLLNQISGETAPLIVTGDFNMSDATEDYQRTSEVLIDSYRESGYGFGFTFPSWSLVPLARLDYIFHSSGLRSLHTQVADSAGNSDHYPVIAQFKLT